MSQFAKILFGFLFMTAIVGTGCGESKEEKQAKNEKEKQEVNKTLNNLSSAYQHRSDIFVKLVAKAKSLSNIDQQWVTGLELAISDAKKITLPDLDHLTLPDLEAFKSAQDQVAASGMSLTMEIKRAQAMDLVELQTQLEAAENRLKTSWNGYNTAATKYNASAEEGKKAPMLTTEDNKVIK